MYIWKIEKLKEQLISKTMDESDFVKYFMINTAICLLETIRSGNLSQYDTTSDFIGFIINILGLWFTYKCNGGKHGNHFVERYISIGFVIFIRFIVISIPIFMVMFIAQEYLLNNSLEEWNRIIFIKLCEILYILLVAKHINYVAKHSV